MSCNHGIEGEGEREREREDVGKCIISFCDCIVCVV